VVDSRVIHSLSLSLSLSLSIYIYIYIYIYIFQVDRRSIGSVSGYFRRLELDVLSPSQTAQHFVISWDFCSVINNVHSAHLYYKTT